MRFRRFIFPALIFLIFLFRAPMVLENFQAAGRTQDTELRALVAGGGSVPYPPAGPAVTLFWATWCAPCKVEMERLKHSVVTGKLPRDRVFLISLGEDERSLRDFLATSDYPFTFLSAADSDRKLPLRATPTLVLWRDGVVQSIGTGMSLWAIWRAEWMF